MSSFPDKLRLKGQAEEDLYFARRESELLAGRRPSPGDLARRSVRVVSGGQTGVDRAALELEDRGRYSGVSDLTLALQFGETLGYDKLSSGGMADVQMNLAMLPEGDLRAISEYLLSLK